MTKELPALEPWHPPGEGGEDAFIKSLSPVGHCLCCLVCTMLFRVGCKSGRDAATPYLHCGNPTGQSGMRKLLSSAVAPPCVAGFFSAQRTTLIQDRFSSLPPHPSGLIRSTMTLCGPQGFSAQGCAQRTLKAPLSDRWVPCFIRRKSLAWGGKPFGRAL